MTSHVKVLGHPLHPMLIVFPLGLFVTSLIFDIIYLGTGDGMWTNVAEYMIGAGVLGGLVAAIPGFIDWLAIPDGTRAKAIGLWHGSGNVLLVVLFIINWFLRLPSPSTTGAGPIVLSFIAVGIGAVTGWLGGELVDRLGIGVDEGANPNASSSLSGRRAVPGEEPPTRRAA